MSDAIHWNAVGFLYFQIIFRTMYDTTKPYTKRILDAIEKTWDTPYISVERGIYPVFRKAPGFANYPDVDHTDGIGTKGVYHWSRRTFSNAVLDALAMNANDLPLARATPYKLQNHIFMPQDDHDAICSVVEALSEECQKLGIAMTGGEASIHDNMDGLEISVTCSGFVKRKKTNMAEPGDVLIGFRSNGLHSNGFTKVREVFGDEYRDCFVEPTKIYADKILFLDDQFDIHGLMHITGGAYTKLRKIVKNADIQIHRHSVKPHDIFFELNSKGVADEEMYRTFNCGVGFVISAPRKQADKILFESGLEAGVIGEVTEGSGRIHIESQFSMRDFYL